MRKFLIIASVAAMLVIVACGDDDSDSDSTANSGSNDAATQTDEGVSAVTTIPDKIDVTQALPKAPPKGKTVAYLQCSIPVCTAYPDGFKEATKALGWNLKIIPMDVTDPASAFQEALDANPDYIGVTSASTDLYKPQVREAISKGIPIFECYGTEAPEPKVNGLYGQCGSSELLAEENKMLADFIVDDSGGKANVLLVTSKEVPILVAGLEGIEKALDACSGCKKELLPVSFADIGAGKIPTQIVSYLTAHPDVQYVAFGFSDVAVGVPEAAAGASLGDIKFLGVSADKVALQAIVDGKQSAWTVQPGAYTSWVMVDGMARHSVGLPLDDFNAETAKISTFVVDKPDIAADLAKGDGWWPGPTGFEEQMKQLWKVGG